MLKYVVPNAITCVSFVFATLAIQCAVAGDIRSAAWWILYCTLSDKLDGIAARGLKATSDFGVQLDSLADLVSFGVAPATVVYAFFSCHPEVGWCEGWRRYALPAICMGYVICAALRLARFNVTAETPRLFFGIPSTFAGGSMGALTAAMVKYGDPAWGGATVGDWRLGGALRLDAYMPFLPWALSALGVAMVSSLRVPKLGRTRWLASDILIWGNLTLCYAIGLFRRLPEYLVASAVAYFAISIGYHFSPTAREVRAPELFKRDPKKRTLGGSF